MKSTILVFIEWQKYLLIFGQHFHFSDHGEVIQEKRQEWYINGCKMCRTVKSLQSILKPICELLISKYADIFDFEAVMCILQNIDNKNPIWFYSSKVNVYDEATILHWAAKFGQLSVIQYVCRLVSVLDRRPKVYCRSRRFQTYSYG